MIIVLSSNIYATSYNDDEANFSFISEDGTIIQYMLDEDQNPYYYQNGEIIYLLIPDYANEVTNPILLSELNNTLENNNSTNSSISRVTVLPSNPTSQWNLGTPYTGNYLFDHTGHYESPIFSYPSNHQFIKITMTNVHHVTFFYRTLSISGGSNFTWYSQIYSSSGTFYRNFQIPYSSITTHLRIDGHGSSYGGLYTNIFTTRSTVW